MPILVTPDRYPLAYPVAQSDEVLRVVHPGLQTFFKGTMKCGRLEVAHVAGKVTKVVLVISALVFMEIVEPKYCQFIMVAI